MFHAYFEEAGVNAPVLLAAFCGAIGRIGLFGPGTGGAMAVVSAVVGGTVTGIYLGPVGPGYLGWAENARSTLAITFLIGMFGMEVCTQVSAAIRKWTPSIKGSKDA